MFRPGMDREGFCHGAGQERGLNLRGGAWAGPHTAEETCFALSEVSQIYSTFIIMIVIVILITIIVSCCHII